MKKFNMTIAALLIGLAANTGFTQTCIAGAEPFTATSRFTLQGDEVLDQRTGLIWQRCSVGQTWNAETESCDGVSLARNWKDTMEQAPEGWRVPNIREVNSITEFSCSRPAINLAVFPDTPLEFFWSSTPVIRSDGSFSTHAWTVYQVYNGLAGSIDKDSALRVRLVKDVPELN